MGLTALSVRRIKQQRQNKAIEEALKKPLTCPIFYEVRSGIMNYRSGAWVRMDPVDIFRTLASAREELKFRQKHPTENQNAAYIIRRYRHGNQNITETMETIH